MDGAVSPDTKMFADPSRGAIEVPFGDPFVDGTPVDAEEFPKLLGG